MIQENFDRIYKKFRIELYRHVFSLLGSRESTLSAADFFSVETIFLMGTPTMTEFASTLCISQPNATYRVKSLVEKGYVEKFTADKKSAARLRVTEKFLHYYHDELDYGNYIFSHLAARMSEEELAAVDRIFASYLRQIELEEGERDSCCRS